MQDRTGQVGYAPTGFLVVILDTTTEEQESDTTKKGQENSRAYRGKPDWTGGRTKEELFSGSDRWQEEKGYDLRWRLYHEENGFKTEQGGGRSCVSTGSKNRARDRESREDHGKRKWRDHTSTRRDEQRRKGGNNIKRNTTIYVGDSIIRKTDTRLSKGEDVVVCLPGARIIFKTTQL